MPRRGQSWQDLPRPNARACLISGPPGIGKTQSVRLVAKELGYELLEFNASDNRSKKTIKELLDQKCTNQGLKGSDTKCAIVMDEIDGVTANDRGGVGELIRIIKFTKMPVICICNDRGNQKLKSLVNHVFELKFTK